MSAYLEIIFVGNQKHGVDIGIGAEGETDQWARDEFDRLKKHQVDIQTAPYVLDLHSDDGEIIDSIGISIETFQELTGKPHKNWYDFFGVSNLEPVAVSWH